MRPCLLHPFLLTLALSALAGPVHANTELSPVQAAMLRRMHQQLDRQKEAEAQAARQAAERAAERDRLLRSWQAAATQDQKQAQADRREPLVARYVTRVLVFGDGRREEFQVPVLNWPRAPRPALETWVSQEDFDGYATAYTNFRSPAYALKGSVLADFVSEEDTQGASLRLRHRLRPEVTLSFYDFDRLEFLPTLETPFLLGYLEGLRARHGSQLTTQNDAAFLSGEMGIEGHSLHCLHYTLETPGATPDEAATIVQRADYLLELGTRLLIVRLEGPEGVLQGARDDWEGFVRSAFLQETRLAAR